MPQHRVLYLTPTHLTAYRAGGRKVEPEADFGSDAVGLEAFGAYLQAHERSLFTLLVDASDEGFQSEDIPHCSGKDRASIISRKLGQHFYGTPYAIASSLGRLKTGRRDERLLMMALTKPQLLSPWINAMRERQAILAGICSASQLLGTLLDKESGDQELLISLTRAGLRQTFFVQRQLRFSRLTPLATGSLEEFSIAVVVEAGKMYQYLVSQRLVDRSKPLSTRVVAHPAHLSALRDACASNGNLRFNLVDLLAEARRQGADLALADSCTEPLLCHGLLRKPPADQFASSVERGFYRLWQTRFALKGIAAAILAGGLLFAAKTMLDMQQTEAEVARLDHEVMEKRRHYDQTLQSLPKITLTTDNLRALVDRYEAVERRAVGPEPMLLHLSRSLDAFPGVALENLEWRIVESVPLNAAVPGPHAQLVVSAHLPLGLVGNQRAQINLVNDFASHLATVPDTEVTVLQPPVDTQSGKTLKSSDEKRMLEAPRFSLRIARRL